MAGALGFLVPRGGETQKQNITFPRAVVESLRIKNIVSSLLRQPSPSPHNGLVLIGKVFRCEQGAKRIRQQDTDFTGCAQGDTLCLLVMANISLLHKHVREVLSEHCLTQSSHPPEKLGQLSLSLFHKLECKAELESQLVRAGAERDPRLSVDRTRGLTILLSHLLYPVVSNLLPPPQFTSSSPLARAHSEPETPFVGVLPKFEMQISFTNIIFRQKIAFFFLIIFGSRACSFKFMSFTFLKCHGFYVFV